MPTLIGTKSDVITTNMVLDKDGRTINGPGIWQSGRSDGIGSSVEVRRISLTPAMCLGGTESGTRSIQSDTPGELVLPSQTTDSDHIKTFASGRIQTNAQMMIYLPTIQYGWSVVNVRVNLTNSTGTDISRDIEVFSRSHRNDAESDQLYIHLNGTTHNGTTNTTMSLTVPFVQDVKGERYCCIYIERDNSSHRFLGGFVSLKRTV